MHFICLQRSICSMMKLQDIQARIIGILYLSLTPLWIKYMSFSGQSLSNLLSYLNILRQDEFPHTSLSLLFSHLSLHLEQNYKWHVGHCILSRFGSSMQIETLQLLFGH